jgi:hypothetical protein
MTTLITRISDVITAIGADIKILYGRAGSTTASVTRSGLNTLAGSSALTAKQLYLVTDEARIAVATGVNTYSDTAKLSEVTSGSITQGQARALGLNIPGV